MVAIASRPADALPPPPALPPAYRLVTLPESGDAFAHACRIAPAAGAGTFVWVRRSDVLAWAVVLEPDEPLAAARRAVFAGMAAMADALSAFAPPEKPVTIAWPATILFDGARLGGGRLGWPDGCAEDEVPAWLVFGGMILAAHRGGTDPGAHPGVTWLEEEGFDPAEIPEIAASFARHLLLAFDTWSERGFGPVAESYLARLPKAPGDGRRGIDPSGSLLVHRPDGLRRVALAGPLREAAWHDPATGLPRL
jgi:Biotin/lipoate A/B protein ligase family